MALMSRTVTSLRTYVIWVCPDCGEQDIGHDGQGTTYCVHHHPKWMGGPGRPKTVRVEFQATFERVTGGYFAMEAKGVIPGA